MATLKDNVHATTAPTTANDSSQGYGVGSEWLNISKGVVYRCVDATVGAAKWILSHVSRHGLVPEGGVGAGGYIFSEGLVATTVSAVSAGIITFQPIRIDHRVSIAKAGIWIGVQGAASEKVRVGIYDADPTTRLPKNKLFDNDSDVTAFSGEKRIDFDPGLLLEPGWYWTACQVNIPSPPGNLTLARVSNRLIGSVPNTSLQELAASGGGPIRYLVSAGGQVYASGMPADATTLGALTKSYSGTDAPVVALLRS